MIVRLTLCALCLLVLSAGSALAEPPRPKDGPLGMKFVPLAKGTFYMGWNGEQGSAKKTEIKEDFEIGVYTVTQGQWQELMGKNPSWFSREGGGKEKVKDTKDEDLKQFPAVRGSGGTQAPEALRRPRYGRTLHPQAGLPSSASSASANVSLTCRGGW
jgi:formylglycine-generating enzyme required for sulfatase activity